MVKIGLSQSLTALSTIKFGAVNDVRNSTARLSGLLEKVGLSIIAPYARALVLASYCFNCVVLTALLVMRPRETHNLYIAVVLACFYGALAALIGSVLHARHKRKYFFALIQKKILPYIIGEFFVAIVGVLFFNAMIVFIHFWLGLVAFLVFSVLFVQATKSSVGLKTYFMLIAEAMLLGLGFFYSAYRLHSGFQLNVGGITWNFVSTIVHDAFFNSVLILCAYMCLFALTTYALTKISPRAMSAVCELGMRSFVMINVLIPTIVTLTFFALRALNQERFIHLFFPVALGEIFLCMFVFYTFHTRFFSPEALSYLLFFMQLSRDAGQRIFYKYLQRMFVVFFPSFLFVVFFLCVTDNYVQAVFLCVVWVCVVSIDWLLILRFTTVLPHAKVDDLKVHTKAAMVYIGVVSLASAMIFYRFFAFSGAVAPLAFNNTVLWVVSLILCTVAGAVFVLDRFIVNDWVGFVYEKEIDENV